MGLSPLPPGFFLSIFKFSSAFLWLVYLSNFFSFFLHYFHFGCFWIGLLWQFVLLFYWFLLFFCAHLRSVHFGNLLSFFYNFLFWFCGLYFFVFYLSNISLFGFCGSKIGSPRQTEPFQLFFLGNQREAGRHKVK